MFGIDLHKQELIFKRNKIISIVFFIALIGAVGNQLKSGAPLWLTIATLCILGGIVGLSFYSYYFQKIPVFSMYAVSVLMSIFTPFGTIDTHLGSILYLSMMLVALYNEWRVVTISFLVTGFTFHFFFRDNVRFDFPEQIIPFYILYTLCFIALFFLVRISEETRILSLDKQKELERSATEIEELLQQSDERTNHLNQFQKELHQNLSLNQQSSDEIVSSFSDITRGMNTQSVNLANIFQSMQSISSVISQVSVSSKQILAVSEQTTHVADNYSAEMEKLRLEMEKVTKNTNDSFQLLMELNEKNKLISQILSTVSDLSRQTDLLALNASIEAARAGESGLGFSIVATEVKNLAANSQKSSEEISRILGEIEKKTKEVTNKVSEGLVIVENSKSTLEKTEVIFDDVSSNSDQIAKASLENEKVMSAVNDSTKKIVDEMNSLTGVTQSINASTEEILQTIESQNEILDKIIKQFD